MKMTKHFTQWYRNYGVMRDKWRGLSGWQHECIDQIAYRAYRKGLKDGRQYERTKTYTF